MMLFSGSQAASENGRDDGAVGDNLDDRDWK